MKQLEFISYEHIKMTANDGLLAHWSHNEEEQMEVRTHFLSVSSCVTWPMQKKNKNNKKKSDPQPARENLIEVIFLPPFLRISFYSLTLLFQPLIFFVCTYF